MNLKYQQLKLSREKKYGKVGALLYMMNAHLKSLYGITIWEYEALLKKQDYKCSICRKFPDINAKDPRRRTLVVDHNHSTGMVRSLLCIECNLALGLLREDINIVNNLLHYIKRYNS